jgi:hypothetical protein
MIDMKKIHKMVVNGGEAISIEELGNKILHIRVMFAHSAEGATVPPLVILPELQHAPVNMDVIRASSEAWLASSKKGWQTRDTFLISPLNFCHWLTIYRAIFGDRLMKVMPYLLILDGHTSRQCPAALKLFRLFNVIILIMPSHISHVLRMFDIGLAAPLKS